MPQNGSGVDLEKLNLTISTWLESRLDSTSFDKLLSTHSEIISGKDEEWMFYSSFSAVPRYTGKDPLSLQDIEMKEAESIREGWRPDYWTIDELGRLFMLLSSAKRPKNQFLERLDNLFISADMGESVALYKSLPVLPYPEELQQRTAEGIRSNVTHVFNAIAHFNPYPAEYLNDLAWNQLILKALFVQSPLWPITGLDSRANADLAKMLIEYVHERWAAGRTFSPELWRPVGPFIKKEWLSDLEQALESGEANQRLAAGLALKESNLPAASELLKKFPDVTGQIDSNQVTWESIGKTNFN